jgi:hypothetical protein
MPNIVEVGLSNPRPSYWRHNAARAAHGLADLRATFRIFEDDYDIDFTENRCRRSKAWIRLALSSMPGALVNFCSRRCA